MMTCRHQVTLKQPKQNLLISYSTLLALETMLTTYTLPFLDEQSVSSNHRLQLGQFSA